MNIGSRLKQILDERQMNVNQLSREAGVSAQTLYAMIKRDSNKADMDIMARLLEALDMDLLEFLQMEPRKKKEAAAGGKKAAASGKETVEESREAESVRETKALAQEESVQGEAEKYAEEPAQEEPEEYEEEPEEAAGEPEEPEAGSRYRRGEIEDYLL